MSADTWKAYQTKLKSLPDEIANNLEARRRRLAEWTDHEGEEALQLFVEFVAYEFVQ